MHSCDVESSPNQRQTWAFVCLLAIAFTIAGCGGASTNTTGGGSSNPPPATPSVTVTTSATAVTNAEPLSVTVSVAGSAGSSPAGTVIVSSGSYASAAVTLSAGDAAVTIPAGLLAEGTDTLTAAYTPASSDATTYAAASGTASITVNAGVTVPSINVSTVSYPTGSAPFDAIVSPTGTVFVGEENGIQVFSPGAGGLVAGCENALPANLISEGGAFAELSYLPNDADVAGGIGKPGAIFYNAAALANCSATGVVISQGPASADEGTLSVAVTPDGKYAFVSNEYGVASGASIEGNVGVVSLTYDSSGDVSGGTLLGQISTGGKAIAGMLLSPDGTRLYVTSEVAASATASQGGSNPVLARTGCIQQADGNPQINGLLSVIDVSKAESAAGSSAILATVDAGCSPVRMAETSDNSTLWVAARGDNRVLAFSTGMLEVNAGNALLGYADTGGTAPVGIALFDKEQLLAVANSNRFGTGPAANLGILSVAYPEGATLVQTVPTGLFPREVTDGPDDATLYLTNYDSDSLEVISTQ